MKGCFIKNVSDETNSTATLQLHRSYILGSRFKNQDMEGKSYRFQTRPLDSHPVLYTPNMYSGSISVRYIFRKKTSKVY
jgi:hypothetical protein